MKKCFINNTRNRRSVFLKTLIFHKTLEQCIMTFLFTREMKTFFQLQTLIIYLSVSANANSTKHLTSNFLAYRLFLRKRDFVYKTYLLPFCEWSLLCKKGNRYFCFLET
jgi:hypothetical protein